MTKIMKGFADGQKEAADMLASKQPPEKPWSPQARVQARMTALAAARAMYQPGEAPIECVLATADVFEDYILKGYDKALATRARRFGGKD